VHFYSFFTSALDGGGFHVPAALSLGKNAGTNLIGGQMGPEPFWTFCPYWNSNTGPSSP